VNEIEKIICYWVFAYILEENTGNHQVAVQVNCNQNHIGEEKCKESLMEI